MFEFYKEKSMKLIRFALPFLISSLFITACSNRTNTTTNTGVNDTTMSDPTNNALDYHPDQRQNIPLPDSSNTIGTDTISGAVATPNTGTQKSFNDQKGKDTIK
jgi:hypothetical protein